MKSSILLFTLVLQSLSLLADNNITEESVPLTLDHIDKLGNIFEPSVELIATQIEAFGTNLTVFVTIIAALVSILSYLGILKPVIDRSRKLEEQVEKQFDRLEKNVSDEVKKQIIYTMDGELEKAQKYARKRIDHEVRKVKENAMERLFAYQELVYEVNQNIKYESDEIMQKEDIDTETKLHAIISIQYQYNEICNHHLPKLFSENIEEVKQTAKALSEYPHIKSVIRLHLYDLLSRNIWSSAQKEELQKVIDKYYGKQ